MGPTTGGAWDIVYRHPSTMAPQLGVAYQPTFLYEMGWNLVIFGLVWVLRRRLRADGALFAIYLGLYAAGKFALTFLRTETVWFWGLQEAQVVALAVMALAALWPLWGRGWGAQPATRRAPAPGAAGRA